MGAETRTVGCGMVSHVSREQPNKVTRYYACHYGPVGNYIGQQIYSPGSPCSRCPYQTQCSNTFQGLCQDNNYRKTNFRIAENDKNEYRIYNYSTRISPNENSISSRNARIVLNHMTVSSRSELKQPLTAARRANSRENIELRSRKYLSGYFLQHNTNFFLLIHKLFLK